MYQLKENKDYNLALALVNRNQFLDAQDRYFTLLAINKDYLADILTPLYKRLAIDFENLQLRILISELYISSELYREAILELEEAFHLDAEFTQTYFLLGKIYRKIGYEIKIKNIFEEAFQKGITDSSILDVLPQFYFKQKDIGKNIDFHEKLSQKFSRNSHYYYTLAELYEKSERFKDAAAMYRKIYEIFPTDKEKIIRRLQELIPKAPNETSIRIHLNDLYLKSFKPLEVIPQIDEMLQKNMITGPEAVETYKTVLNQYPYTKEIILALVHILIEQKEYSEAVNYLNELFTVINDQRLYPAIISLLDLILQRYPQQISAKNLLIDMYFSQKDFRKSLNYIEQLISVVQINEGIGEKLKIICEKTEEEKSTTRILLAKYYFLGGEFQNCIENSKKLLQTEFKLEAQLLIVEAQFEKGQTMSSKRNIRELLINNIYNCKIHETNKKIYEKSVRRKILKQSAGNIKNHEVKLFRLGIAHLQQRDFYAAVECFQKILNNEELKLKAQVLIGRSFLENGRFDLSVNHLQHILSQHKSLETDLANKLRYMISVNLLNSGKISEAVTYLENIMQYDINFPNIKTILDQCNNWRFFDFRGKIVSGCHLDDGTLYLISTPNMEGYDFLKKQSSPQNLSLAYTHNNQGFEHLLKKQLQAAEDEFNLAVTLDHSLTSTHCNLAVLNLLKEDIEKAHSHLDTALKINHNLDAVWLSRGLIYIKENKLDTALVSFRKALKINPENYLAKYNLGDLYYRKKEIRLAFENWKGLLKLNNIFYLIRRRLEYINPKDSSFDTWINDLFANDIEEFINMGLLQQTQYKGDS
ncbi:tetratricopeptide repeat protein [Candidatus Margulisiibacteriota bacterium]